MVGMQWGRGKGMMIEPSSELAQPAARELEEPVCLLIKKEIEYRNRKGKEER